MRDLVALPKAHLHLHLEGGMRPGTLEELAHRSGMAVPEVRGFGDFSAFAGMYLAACEVLRTPDDLARLVGETVDDAVAAGAVHVEPAFSPLIHEARLGDPETVLGIALEAGADASARTGVCVGFLLTADRTADPSVAVELARLAARHADRGVVAFGLANDEGRFPPEPFAEAFRVAGEAGLLRAPHAGELRGPDSVRAALDVLGADRIQHGVRAVEDPALVERLAVAGVCLDVCPTSNAALGVFPLDGHPLPALLDAGVRCSLNADDPLLFGPGLLEEYEIVRDAFGFNDERLAWIARCSVEASGAPDTVKKDALAGIDAWLG